MMTHQQLNDFAQFFAFGEKTGSALAEQESRGVPFCPAWVKQNRHIFTNWSRGDSANAGIGQGGWIVTPLQILLATNFALTGQLLRPKFYLDEATFIRKSHSWKTEHQKVILDGMRGCVTHGTGTRLNKAPVPILAKTGTAEVGAKKPPHSWMIGAVPADSPRYIAVVMVENGGSGGKTCAPLLGKLLSNAVSQP